MHLYVQIEESTRRKEGAMTRKRRDHSGLEDALRAWHLSRDLKQGGAQPGENCGERRREQPAQDPERGKG